jgi:leucine dehydrogenase
MADSTIFGKIKDMDHEEVVHCYDKRTGLRAIIAIHNTTLGPGLGGTRMWRYDTEEEALVDVLRLSRGMTYKAAIAGLPLGGAKAVILGNPRKDKTPALFQRYGEFIDRFGGKFVTAEDMGMSTTEIDYLSQATKHVVGLPETKGGSGDPSPVTAYGVYMGMKAAAKFTYGADSLNGLTVLVQGLGNVGKQLVALLNKEGARIKVSDIFDDKIKAVSKFNVEVVNPEDLFEEKMDIYAPCALGATVNDLSLESMDCKIIAGSANNQLADEKRHGQLLTEKGVVYAPDYLINAGGLINCYQDLVGYDRKIAMTKTERIYDETLKILQDSSKTKRPTYMIANKIAESRFKRQD